MTEPVPEPRAALSVTDAMARAKSALESVRVRVVGEVSEFSDKPGYKAAYFTLCDDGASMPCLMWRDAYAASGVTLRCGMLIEVTGAFSAYVPKGRMQFVVRSMQPAGEGTLRMQVAALARKLEVEGLMRSERKRRLPRLPQRIGVVTSPRGKAVHDVLRTLRRRYPIAEVVLAGVAVEGADAPSQIAEGLRVIADASPDVVLLVRGGGSFEDLMPFNSEEVARAIAASPVPVVSGVGHEPDTTIADMVADVRASTPTAAAEAAAPSVAELAETLEREGRMLAKALRHRTDLAKHLVVRISERRIFCDAHAPLGSREQTLDVLGARLRLALPSRIERVRERGESMRSRLRRAGEGLVRPARTRLELAGARLEDLSPHQVLARGYSVAYDAAGAVLRDASQVAEGDSISVRLAHGLLEADVIRKQEEA